MQFSLMAQYLIMVMLYWFCSLYGGGIFVAPFPFDSSSFFYAQLINVNIFSNVSRMWGGGVAGRGISISGGTIKENTATYFGGGVYKGGHIYSLGNIDF
ncbi:hypothetical protein Ct9H90mP29_08560 [bacterium]|nr:MAG: hypothetical protein Ct9H90mP29_08560 [bacterium]